MTGRDASRVPMPFFSVCGSPSAAGVREQSAAWGGGELPTSRREVELPADSFIKT